MTDGSASLPDALAVAGLEKAFGATPVLRGLDLRVRPGELVSILGASGGGKTTLLRLLCGFERADRGSIHLSGRPVDAPADAPLDAPPDTSANGSRPARRRRRHERPEHRRLGYVAQEGGLFPHLTVAANILFGLPRAERADPFRADALLELVGLSPAYAARPPHSLSGGEQQRVALARALAPRPSLVLLDEPFSALDAGSRAGTRRAVAAALAESGASALLVTHDQGEALSMGHRVGVLRRGVLAQIDTPDALYRRPCDPELAAFVGEAVLLDASCRDGIADTPLGRIPLDAPVPGTALPDGPARVLLRPEQLVLAPPGTGASGAPEALVLSVSYYGHDAGIALRLAAAPELRFSARVNGNQALALRAGDRVSLGLSGSATAFPPG